MTNVFFSGSRRLTRLSEAVREHADRLIEEGETILVGDANGADKAMQEYLARKGYDRVLVFCTGGRCRNNVGRWKTVHVEPGAEARKGFRYYARKDRRMSEEAEQGLVMWDGESKGTLNNLLNLLEQGKTALVHVAGSPGLRRVSSRGDLAALIAADGGRTLDRLEAELRAKAGAGAAQKEFPFDCT
ncbi:MAG: hypothetical protein ACOC8E_09115 [Planctomycetota bacterium]